MMFGLWQYSNHFNIKIQDQFKVSLQEGNTPLETYEQINNYIEGMVYFKREDMNPTGSHKDRNSVVQIAYHWQQENHELVLSSSGNNAISAAAYVLLTPLELTLFLPKHVNLTKRKRLEEVLENDIKKQITTIWTDRAQTEAFRYAKEKRIPNLVPSTDPVALEGMSTLGVELAQAHLPFDAIFIPTSSGTAFAGVFQGYQWAKQPVPSLHCVQTSKIHPISSHFDKDFTPEPQSLAKAIVSRNTKRKEQVTEIINKTNGSGWTIQNSDLRLAQELLQKSSINTSFDSALSLAGLLKAKKNGYNYSNVVCILTGK